MTESDGIAVLTTDVFEEMVLRSSKPVIIFCQMKDSGLCNIKYEEFRRSAKKHADKFRFYSLDIVRSKDLAFEYRVMSVPALLYFNQGELTERWANIQYNDNIDVVIERALGSKFQRLPAGILHVTEGNYPDIVEKSSVLHVLNFWKSDHEPSWLLMPDFLDLTEKYKGKAVFSISNFDESRDLATKFRVSNVPTMIFVRRGEAVDRLVGIQSRQAIEKIIRTRVEEG